MRFPRPRRGVRGPRQNSGSIGQRWKRREALASRLVLMGRHHTQPPHPTRPAPNTKKEGERETKQEEEGRPTGRQPPPPTPPTNTRGRNRGSQHRGKGCRNHYTNHDQPTPQTPPNPNTGHKRGGGRGSELETCGGHSTGETPSNIPNLEAKPGRANGTAPQGVWESRKPPQHTTVGGPHTVRAPHKHTQRTQKDAHKRARHTQGHAHARDAHHARHTLAKTRTTDAKGVHTTTPTRGGYYRRRQSYSSPQGPKSNNSTTVRK